MKDQISKVAQFLIRILWRFYGEIKSYTLNILKKLYLTTRKKCILKITRHMVWRKNVCQHIVFTFKSSVYTICKWNQNLRYVFNLVFFIIIWFILISGIFYFILLQVKYQMAYLAQISLQLLILSTFVDFQFEILFHLFIETVVLFCYNINTHQEIFKWHFFPY